MAQGTKTQNLIINLDHDPEWIFDDDYQTLEGVGCRKCIGQPQSIVFLNSRHSAILTTLLLLVEPWVENETELSFFNRRAYEEYKANPVNKWE